MSKIINNHGLIIFNEAQVPHGCIPNDFEGVTPAGTSNQLLSNSTNQGQSSALPVVSPEDCRGPHGTKLDYPSQQITEGTQAHANILFDLLIRYSAPWAC